jgi:ABC-2 type transport system ATP-binding protein
MGKTILVSSHILPELADICNKIGIIERGQLLFDGDVKEAMERVRPHTVLNIRVADRTEDALKLLEVHPSISKIEPKDGMLVATLVEGVNDPSFVADILVHEGFKLHTLKEEEINLETAFMRITKGITQ